MKQRTKKHSLPVRIDPVWNEYTRGTNDEAKGSERASVTDPYPMGKPEPGITTEVTQ